MKVHCIHTLPINSLLKKHSNMVETVCNNMENTNLIPADISEQKLKTNDDFINDENPTTNGNMQLDNYFCGVDNHSSSGTSKNSSNSSSEVMEATASQQNSNTDRDPNNIASNGENGDETSCTNASEKSASVRRFRTIIDSDSEGDELTSLTVNKSKLIGSNSQVNQLTKKSKSKSSRLRIDSDSDDDDNDVDNMNEGKNDDNQSGNNELVINTKSKGLSDLIDSESEDENDSRNNYSSSEELKEHPSVVNESQKKSKKEKPVKKRTGTKRAAKDEAMRHIHSETQRLVREAPVSLPYHRPKQRSLQEFLNRKKIATVIPQASTAAAKLRMCTAIVSAVVKAKEKEAQLFYKSSDSEDDELSISVQPQSLQHISSLPFITPASISIEETQKLHKIDIQNAHNKKQIIQQGILELGVPRKLFSDDANDSLGVQSNDTPAIVQQPDDEVKKRMKECKQGMKEVSMPRKLFDNNFEDYTGGSFEKHDSFSSDSTLPVDNNVVGSQVDTETTQSSDTSHAVQVKNDEDDSVNGKISQTTVILSSKSFENSQDSSQLLQDGKIIDLTAIQSTSTSHSGSMQSENCPIYDTPLTSLKEIQNLNDKSISEKSLILSNEICTDDTSQSSEADCGVEGLPLPVFDDYGEEIKLPPKVSMTVKKNTLINVPKLKPKLRGTPGTFIDFTQSVKPNKKAVNNLVDRFITKHSVVNKHIESNSKVTVIRTEATAEGLKIYKDVLPYNLPVANELIDDSELNKPGAKLMRLKGELERKMANKRNKEWKQREQELMVDEDEEDEEASSKEFEPEGSDNASATDEEIVDTEESELEENDILINDKKRKSCAFGDEEAEVDEDGDMELSNDEMEEDDGEEDGYEEDEGNEYDKNEDGEDSTQEQQKKFSRIVTADDDSNSGEASDDLDISAKFKRRRTDVDMFGDDEDELPISQQIVQASQLSPVFKTPLTPNNPPNSLESRGSQFSALSYDFPRIDYNSKLNNLNSQSSDWQSQNDNGEIKNKLFEIQDPNVTDEELMALCSGKFTDGDNNMQNDNRQRLIGLIDSTSGEKPVTESQIIGMCSGSFSSRGLFSSTDLGRNVDETSQDMRLTFDDSSQNSNDNILERKQKEAKIDSEIQSSIQSFLDIASSSEDDIEDRVNDRNVKKVLKKKKVKQLVLSDDDDDDDEDEEIHEERQINEEQEEDSIESNEDEEKFIDYDSEENEVVVVNKKDLKKVAANFVDAEAELSESEWGSEDEDEKGMDKLELEEGDGEEIDEDQMRAQLGKLHARQLLDDDQRDVRMLKEMLFEDGDLHTDGSGRERRFKWRNIDKLGDENLLEPTNDDDDGNQLDPTELANELEWRKLRLEREKFLEEKMKSETNLDTLDDVIDMVSGGELLKLGMRVLKKCKTSIEIRSSAVHTSKPIVPRTVSELIGTPDGKTRILHKAMKRGSFLARGDEALARLAVMIKKSDTVDLAPKHSKNFLFTHISPSVTGRNAEEDENDSENKREENIENNEKPARKRKTISGTPRTAKKLKIDINLSSGKKLF